jgi:glycosyltransferase involved in cell wall biosynthesis
MALGRPCLVTPGTNLADVVSEAGGWVTEAEPGAIAESIRRICKSRSSLPAVGRKLQNLARSKFNWCKIAKQLKEEYIAICKQNT